MPINRTPRSKQGNPKHLSRSDHGRTIYQVPNKQGRDQSKHGKHGLDPALKSALILLIPMSGLRLLVIFPLNLRWFGLLLISVVYIFAGYLAAMLFFQKAGRLTIRPGTNPAREKSIASAMLLCLGSWAIFVLVVAFTDLAVTDGPNLIWLGPIEFLFAILFGVLGARLKSHSYR